MNNYLLSIDPSIKNTGFTLWEKIKDYRDYKNNTYEEYWKPIWINSYEFKRYTNISDCLGKKCTCEWKLKIISHISDRIDYLDNLNLIIERGIFNPKMGRGKETLDHLRGFIAGQFNKLLTKDMLISPKAWQNWYLKKYFNELENKKTWNDKEISFSFALRLIAENNWNITISNNDEADSLLIGWYYLNKDVK